MLPELWGPSHPDNGLMTVCYVLRDRPVHCDITCCMWSCCPPQPPDSSSATGWQNGCESSTAWVRLVCLAAGLTWVSSVWRASTAVAPPGQIYRSLWGKIRMYTRCENEPFFHPTYPAQYVQSTGSQHKFALSMDINNSCILAFFSSAFSIHQSLPVSQTNICAWGGGSSLQALSGAFGFSLSSFYSSSH